MDAILLIGPLHVREVIYCPEKTERAHEHIHDIGYLLSPVSDAEFTFLKLLGHLFLFIRILSREVLHVFHQPLHIAQAQKFGDKRLGREAVKVVKMFTNTQEDDRCFCSGNPVHE